MIWILILDGAYASSVAATLDMLATAARIAAIQNSTVPRWRVCSSTANRVALTNGLELPVGKLPRSILSTDIVVIPGLGAVSPSSVMRRLQQSDIEVASKWLRLARAAGATLYAGCTGVFLLASAGLLTDRKVTTSWWMNEALKSIEPRVHVDTSKMVIESEHIVSAGAAMAHTDLMLHLLTRHFGVALADLVSRYVVVSERASQATFMLPAQYTTGNELVQHISRIFQNSLPNALSVKDLAAEVNLTERTLARRIVSATGRTPLQLMQGVRLHLAQRLLSESSLTIEEVAVRIGYADSTALRKLLKNSTQMTPTQIRIGRLASRPEG
jgi:transcriptional regulator GlxA family with amidase domain